MQVRLSADIRTSVSQLLLDRFSSNSVYVELDPRERGEGFRTASEALLNLRDISPVTIQACVLLGAYAAAHGDTDIENVYYSTAGRMCLVLDLPNRPVASLLEREVNIRGMCSLTSSMMAVLPGLSCLLIVMRMKYGGQSVWLMYGHRPQLKFRESCLYTTQSRIRSTRYPFPQ